MTDNRAFLTNFVPTEPETWFVSGIGKASLAVAGQGDAILTATVNGEDLQGTNDPCLYFRHQGEELIVVLFFIDDAIACGKNSKALEDFVNHLKKKFEL